MKRRNLLITLSLIASSLTLASCGDTNQGASQIGNPWSEVVSIDKLDDAIKAKADFSPLAFKDIEKLSSTETLAQIAYKDGSMLRIQKGNEAEDISGIHGAVSSNYYSFTGAYFEKYFEDDVVYAYWSNGTYVFCYSGSKGQDEKTVDETVTKIYNLYK